MDRRNILKIFHKRFYFLHPDKLILPWAIVLAFLVFLPFAPSSGKVFWSRLLTKGQSIFDPTDSWRQIYKCPMIINGQRASLSVYGADDPLPSVTTKRKQNFSSSKEKNNANNQVSRLLMLAMPNSGKSVIFELCQQPNEFSKPPALPSESAVFGRSLPAGSRLTATIKNEETGATMETLMTGLPPERAGNELSEHLSRNGWKDISSAADNDASVRYFQIYQRKDALCIIMVGRALRENKTCVTILLKEINMQ